MAVVVDGGTTNKSFLLDLLDRPEVHAGAIDTSWLDRLTASGAHLPTRHGDVALVAAALDADDLIADIDRAAFFGAASRGRAHTDTSVGREIEMRLAGQPYSLAVRRLGAARYDVELDGVVVAVEVERLGRGRSRLSFGGLSFAVVSSVQGSDHLVEVDGVAHRCSRDDAGIVRAPAAALVVGIDVQPEQVVSSGDRLGVVEAMKMEIGITAPVSGRVRDVFVARNVQVDAGAPLFRIEPVVDDTADVPAGERVDLGALRATSDDGDETLEHLFTVKSFLLGFDVTIAEAGGALAAAMARRNHELPAAVARELEIVEVFTDLAAVAPERRDPDDDGDDTRAPARALPRVPAFARRRA